MDKLVKDLVTAIAKDFIYGSSKTYCMFWLANSQGQPEPDADRLQVKLERLLLLLLTSRMIAQARRVRL